MFPFETNLIIIGRWRFVDSKELADVVGDALDLLKSAGSVDGSARQHASVAGGSEGGATIDGPGQGG